MFWKSRFERLRRMSLGALGRSLLAFALLFFACPAGDTDNDIGFLFTDDDLHYTAGNCSECDSAQTVLRIGDEAYFCCSCFEIFNQMSNCGFCNEPNTGDMEFSYWGGCNMCDGKSGWDND